jgi:chromatin remodeling complex protein RSC6
MPSPKSCTRVSKKPKSLRGLHTVFRPVIVAPKLRKFLNTPKDVPLYRHTVIKKMWAYIKTKNLQLKTDGRYFKLNKKLSSMLGVTGKTMYITQLPVILKASNLVKTAKSSK